MTTSKKKNVGKVGLLRDERGGIFAEAVIALPVFVLAYSLIVFVHDGYNQAHIEAKAARATAADHTMRRACDGDVGGDPDTAQTNASGMGVVSLGALALFGSQFATRVVPRNRGLMLYLGTGGMYGVRLSGYQFQDFSYNRTGSIDRPLIGGSSSTGASISMRCNELGIGRNLFRIPTATTATINQYYNRIRP